MSRVFASGGQSIGVSASASVLPMNIQDWSPLGWTGWISLQSKFSIDVWLLYNVVLVFAVELSESAICTHIPPASSSSLLPHPSQSTQSAELSALCCASVSPSCASCTWSCRHVSAALWIRPALFFPRCAPRSVLCICVSTPALRIGSSVLFFYILCVYVSVAQLCVTLWPHGL